MTKNILFLCTGNSARSVMAEAYMNHTAQGRWLAHSAGSYPTGTVNPFTIETLSDHGITPHNPHSKSWDEFTKPDAPIMDVVVTVCDNAASEVCPVWPSQNGTPPPTLHWGFPDPAIAENKPTAFNEAFESIRITIDRFLAEQDNG